MRQPDPTEEVEEEEEEENGSEENDEEEIYKNQTNGPSGCLKRLHLSGNAVVQLVLYTYVCVCVCEIIPCFYSFLHR